MCVQQALCRRDSKGARRAPAQPPSDTHTEKEGPVQYGRWCVTSHAHSDIYRVLVTYKWCIHIKFI